MTLHGKLALVTGASRGIGAATAEALARAGCHVIVTARTEAGLIEVDDRIAAAGEAARAAGASTGGATIAPFDLKDGDAIDRLAAAVASRWGKLDILVLNAATLGTLTPVPHIAPKDFDFVVGAQPDRQLAADPRVRSPAPPERRRAAGDADVVGRDHPARLLGHLCRDQGRARHARPDLRRGGAEHHADPGRGRRSGRDGDRRCAPAPSPARTRRRSRPPPSSPTRSSRCSGRISPAAAATASDAAAAAAGL